MAETKYYSTSALSKRMGWMAKELFSLFQAQEWMVNNGQGWELTDKGKAKGGVYKESRQYGKYVAWPESVLDDPVFENHDRQGTSLSSTAIGKHFSLSAQNINAILSELGWIRKGDIKGWELTDYGRKMGGEQREHSASGVPFVNWPCDVLNHRSLIQSVEEYKGDSQARDEDSGSNGTTDTGFREKFEAKLRTTDGHYVRSKAEMLIDNWLYMAEIVHAYERKLPVEEEVYCDFYIPTGKLYIEFWGYENDSRYLERKKVKKEVYAKYDFPLIELTDADVQNLDDVLPAKLLKFGIRSY